jgi:ribosomal protein S18 acetylase RimI-like enzyme
MEIRRATGDDVQTLSALAVETYATAFGHTMDAADLATLLEQQLSEAAVARWLEADTLLLAEEQGRLIGFVQVGALHADDVGEPGDYELRRLYVHADFQGRGLGARLLELALDVAQRAGAPRLFLEVWSQNPGAQRLYERFDFRVCGVRRYAWATSDDLIMVRETALS